MGGSWEGCPLLGGWSWVMAGVPSWRGGGRCVLRSVPSWVGGNVPGRCPSLGRGVPGAVPSPGAAAGAALPLAGLRQPLPHAADAGGAGPGAVPARGGDTPPGGSRGGTDTHPPPEWGAGGGLAPIGCPCPLWAQGGGAGAAPSGGMVVTVGPVWPSMGLVWDGVAPMGPASPCMAPDGSSMSLYGPSMTLCRSSMSRYGPGMALSGASMGLACPHLGHREPTAPGGCHGPTEGPPGPRTPLPRVPPSTLGC